MYEVNANSVMYKVKAAVKANYVMYEGKAN